METSSKTCVAVDTEQATLFVALELSQATWLVGLHSPIADKISINRIDGGDTDKLLALIEKKREQAARQLGRPVRVVSCYPGRRLLFCSQSAECWASLSERAASRGLRKGLGLPSTKRVVTASGCTGS